MSFRPAGMSDDDEDVNSIDLSTSEYNNSPMDQLEETRTDWQTLAQKQPQSGVYLDCDTMEELKKSIIEGEVDKLEVLSSSYDLNQPIVTGWDTSGIRPIFLAAENGKDEVIEFLLEKKVNLAPDSNGLTPLMTACGSNQNGKDLAKCAKILLALTDPNEHQEQKINSLMLASKNGNDKVVEELVKHPKICLDAQDTQGWTSLLYAIDAGYGNIARILLDAGANPDIAALDGMFPIDVAMTRKNDFLVAIIQDFSKKRNGIVLQPSQKVRKYSDIDTILSAVSAQEYCSLFEEHNIDLAEFLVLNEEDLVEIGIDKVGVRKRLLTVIADMNKREWEKSSLPKINPRHKQSGIYISLPDAILIIGSINRHLRFIAQNVEFVNRQIKAKPEILEIGCEVSSVQDLHQFTGETQHNLALCSSRLRSLKRSLGSNERQILTKTNVLMTPIIIVGIYYSIKFVQKFL